MRTLWKIYIAIENDHLQFDLPIINVDFLYLFVSLPGWVTKPICGPYPLRPPKSMIQMMEAEWSLSRLKPS